MDAPRPESGFGESSTSTMRLRVPARAENVTLIRHAVAGIGDALGMDEEALANLKTVVTEACNNTVIHAYDEDAIGTLDVSVAHGQDSLEVVVRDYGRGFRPRLTSQRAAPPSLRLGLSLIATLSSGFELRAPAGGGTELRVVVPIEAVGEAAEAVNPELLDETVLTIEDEALAGIVVSRVVSALAARASLSVDRLSDVLLLSDAIAVERPDGYSGGQTRMAIEETGDGITVRVGPLHDGAGDRMLAGLAIPSLDASLKTLADEALVERDDRGEHLVLRIVSGHPASRG
jgi:serine/threonine-protein kinase RsbW